MLSAIWCCLVLANLFWAAFISKDFSVALDRSVAQGIALVFVYFQVDRR